jgi:hypothetical protein
MINLVNQEMKEQVKAKCWTIFSLTCTLWEFEDMLHAYLYISDPLNFPESHGN